MGSSQYFGVGNSPSTFSRIGRVEKLPTLPLTEEVSAQPPPPHPKWQRQSRAEVSEINRIDWAFLCLPIDDVEHLFIFEDEHLFFVYKNKEPFVFDEDLSS